METCFTTTSAATGYFSSDERRWITRIHKLKEEHPDQVRIIKEPKDNDGCIYAEIPAEWFKVAPKRRVSDEQREKMKIRMQNKWNVSSEHAHCV